ncbi:MAG: YbhB/YbcL family Raf kinase inhibitor-like protein [Myxococcota bacterium]
MTLTLTSPAFQDGAELPAVFTCEGDDESPPLSWSGAPAGTKSFVLIIDDPDAPDPAAPKRVWLHWAVYNLPASCHGLEQNVRQLPRGALEGVTDSGRTGYGGPCPPIGRHRYFHRLFALDTVLPDLHTPKRKQLEAAMEGHVLATAVLMGTYQKRGR